MVVKIFTLLYTEGNVTFFTRCHDNLDFSRTLQKCQNELKHGKVLSKFLKISQYAVNTQQLPQKIEKQQLFN